MKSTPTSVGVANARAGLRWYRSPLGLSAAAAGSTLGVIFELT
jgi:hypothetical protein